jgi:hypothetical protein
MQNDKEHSVKNLLSFAHETIFAALLFDINNVLCHAEKEKDYFFWRLYYRGSREAGRIYCKDGFYAAEK